MSSTFVLGLALILSIMLQVATVALFLVSRRQQVRSTRYLFSSIAAFTSLVAALLGTMFWVGADPMYDFRTMLWHIGILVELVFAPYVAITRFRDYTRSLREEYEAQSEVPVSIRK